MTKVTCRAGMARKRASWARAPTSSSGASVSSQRPSARSRRLPASALGADLLQPAQLHTFTTL